MTCLENPRDAKGELSIFMPSTRLASVLRKRTLLRHWSSPTPQAPTVSPNIIITPWSAPVLPLSHMMPRSVPETLKRSMLLFGLPGPVTISRALVLPLRIGRAPSGEPVIHGSELASDPVALPRLPVPRLPITLPVRPELPELPELPALPRLPLPLPFCPHGPPTAPAGVAIPTDSPTVSAAADSAAAHPRFTALTDCFLPGSGRQSVRSPSRSPPKMCIDQQQTMSYPRRARYRCDWSEN